MNIITFLSYYCYCCLSNKEPEKQETNICYLNKTFLEEHNVSVTSTRDTELSLSDLSRISGMSGMSSMSDMSDFGIE